MCSPSGICVPSCSICLCLEFFSFSLVFKFTVSLKSAVPELSLRPFCICHITSDRVGFWAHVLPSLPTAVLLCGCLCVQSELWPHVGGLTCNTCTNKAGAGQLIHREPRPKTSLFAFSLQGPACMSPGVRVHDGHSTADTFS